MRPILRILALWRPQALVLGAGLGMTAVAALALAGLSLSAGAAPLAAGAVVLLVLRALGAGRVVLRYLERLATHAATFRALSALRIWMFRGLARRSGGGLGFMRRGDALARMVGDVDALDGLYLRIMVPAVGTAVLLLALAVVLGRSAPAVAVVVFALLGMAAFVIPFGAARAGVAEGGRLVAAQSGLRVAALDTLAGMREVRAFGNEGRMLALVQARESTLFAAQRRVARSGALAQGAAMLCGQAALLLVVVGFVPTAVVLPAVLLTLAAFEAASAMPRAGALLGRAAAAAARVIEAADDTAPASGPVGPASAPRDGGLRFEAVRFAWPGRPAVFDGLTLDIPAGSRVAILGPSGAGKSTLAALALRVVTPGAGRVLLGGADIASLDAADVRSRIAWLSQATHVFADTIRANLLLGRPDADEAALWQALSQAGLDEVVNGLPDGLDTWIGEGGAGLSGGQQRRVALARALLSQAAERAFFMQLNQAAIGRTVVLIVHRLLGVEQLDRIWRLSGGRAVAAAG
jgi:ATP-binding cassette subfamily C protein CydC